MTTLEMLREARDRLDQAIARLEADAALVQADSEAMRVCEEMTANEQDMGRWR